jgi:hypothetical protein
VHRQLAAMADFLTDIWTFHIWAVIAAFGALLTIVSIIADRRRGRRTVLDNVGFMPWTAISLFSIGLTMISIALAIKTW